MTVQHRTVPHSARSLFAMVLGAGLAASSTASADIVASGMVDINIPSDEFGVVIDLATGESGPARDVPGWDFQFSNAFSLLCDGAFDTNNGFVRGFEGAGGVNNLPLGTMVGPGLNLWTSSSEPSYDQPAANWVFSSGDNYVGVRFLNEATGQYHYGWMRFCVADVFGEQPRSIVEYAYEAAPNTAIAIGAGGTGMPANCGGAPQCLSAPACGDTLPASNSIECLTFEATASCNTKLFTRDVDWRLRDSAPFRNTTWAGPTGSPVDVTVVGIDPKTFETAFYELTFETLSLRDVRMDPAGFKFRLNGDQTGLVLENALLRCSPFPPIWYDPSPLALTVPGGTSTLLQLNGLIGSTTTLSVEPGATLRFDFCGATGFGIPDADRCYFSNTVNHADIDGGTLELERSHVIFKTGSGEMRVRNGGLLKLFDGQSMLETGTLNVENASIALGLGSVGIEAEVLKLRDATVTFEPSSNIVSDATQIRGTTTIDIDLAIGTSTGLSTGLMTMHEPNAHLVLSGDGQVEVLGLILSDDEPKVTLTESADLVITDSLGFWNAGTFEILGETSTLEVQQNGLVASSIPILNEGRIGVEGQFSGEGVISGSGIFETQNQSGVLAVLGPTDTTLQIDGPIFLGPLSTLKIALDPLQARSQRLIAGTSVVMESLGAYLNAYVAPANDAVLPAGTKFGILDYPSVDDFNGLFWKSDDSGDLEPGALLTIGLNTYRLAYYDEDFDASNPTMVTLTVVGSDSCPADLTHDGMVDGADLSILLQDWGTCPPKGGCPADFNHDGMVDGADLSILLEEWGACP